MHFVHPQVIHCTCCCPQSFIIIINHSVFILTFEPVTLDKLGSLDFLQLMVATKQFITEMTSDLLRLVMDFLSFICCLVSTSEHQSWQFLLWIWTQDALDYMVVFLASEAFLNSIVLLHNLNGLEVLLHIVL